MKEPSLILLRTLAKGIAVASLAAIFCAPSQGQIARPTPPPSLDPDRAAREDPRTFASIEEEFRAKNAIKAAEKGHQENLERARDLSFLSEALISSYKQKNLLDREDLKKLEKAEKLARGIREAAGGSEDDTKIEKPPGDLSLAVKMFGELSESLKAKVEKTPKHVISAAVIDEANVLLEVIRIVRALAPKS
jgi:hypothetical protein